MRDLDAKTAASKERICVTLLHNEPKQEVRGDVAPKTIYDICYRMPPKNVAPPPGVRVVELKTASISLSLHRMASKSKRPKKRRKLKDAEVFEDSEEDVMLFSQREERMLEADAIVAVIDATLRRSIAGDAIKAGSFIRGLTIKHMKDSISFLQMAPALFSEKALNVR